MPEAEYVTARILFCRHSGGLKSRPGDLKPRHSGNLKPRHSGNLKPRHSGEGRNRS